MKLARIKLALTGGTGFVGSHFLENFGDKYDIVLIGRKDIRHPKYETRQTDFSEGSLIDLLKDCTAILHLAAARPYLKSKKSFEENLIINQNVFKAALALDIKNVIFASTRGIYGTLPTPWVENMEPMPNTLYSLAKYQSEIAAKYYIRQGLNIKILRIAQVFGLGEYESSAIATFIRNCKENRPLEITVTGIHREYIYVKDLASALDAALGQTEVNGIFNVGSGEMVSLENIAKKIANAFGKPHLVHLVKNPKQLYEKSLMDSTLFRHTFHWSPSYSFEEAAEDIAMSIKS